MKTTLFYYINEIRKNNVARLIKFVALTVMVGVLGSCTAKRFVPDGKKLVHKNRIEINPKSSALSKSDLSLLIGQAPNQHFLGSRFGLWTYYMTENRKDKKLWNWVNVKFGQPPVYYDQQSANASSMQMSRYLHNLGYFNNTVSFEPKIHSKTLTVIYKIHPSLPYTINDLQYSIQDSAIAALFYRRIDESLLKTGESYNAYKMDDERDRITNQLRNEGYFYFTKDHIVYEVDSNLQSRSVNINLRIENRSLPVAGGGVSLQSHRQYYIRHLNIYPNHQPFQQSSMPPDTLLHRFRPKGLQDSVVFRLFSNGNPRIRPQAFHQIIQIHPGELSSLRATRQTYKGLTNLRIFRASNITFDTTGSRLNTDSIAPAQWVDCNIYLQRSKVHSYTIDLEGTNSGGDPGIRGSLVYSNKNLFRGAELFRLRLNGGFEAQRLSAANLPEGDNKSNIFNTTEIGLDVSINFPRFLSPISFGRITRDYQPKTNLVFGFGSQVRPNYERTILRTAFGYDWMSSNTISHLFSPVNLSSVKVNPSPGFEAFLNQLTNRRLKDQYSNHLIFSLKYSFIFNNQNINRLRDFMYFRFNIESSGNLLALFNKSDLYSFNDGHYELLGIRYAQFMRFDNDFRYYKVLSENNRLVFRTMLGIGLPYGNSSELPFERSFYAGGANGMRGWQFRQLGPGSYSDTLSIERTGDIHLEANFEYRFPIYSYLKGAFFVDAGNIWYLRNRSDMPGSSFRPESFYKEIAMDAGLGFRLDLSFFVFRLDAALPLRDPAKVESERWRFNDLKLRNTVWNFGIGYPF